MNLSTLRTVIDLTNKYQINQRQLAHAVTLYMNAKPDLTAPSNDFEAWLDKFKNLRTPQQEEYIQEALR